MRKVGVYEAKTKLASLLDAVSQGESVVITRHGIPVAHLVPPPKAKPSPEEIVKAFEEFSKGNRLDGITIRELIEEGRKY